MALVVARRADAAAELAKQMWSPEAMGIEACGMHVLHLYLRASWSDVTKTDLAKYFRYRQ